MAIRGAKKWESLRKQMVTEQLIGRGIANQAVLNALQKVPREQFLPEAMQHRAYDDAALPIACNQTISQPLMVALMSDGLSLGGNERILEIGTGSGYQTAILAEMIGPKGQLWSIERHAELSQSATEKLRALGYTDIHLRVGDGTLGLPEQAPYDAILIAAAAPRCPPALWDQLRIGGRLVIPVGPTEKQQLVVLEKDKSGAPMTTNHVSCRFVPLIGEGL
jgi:protein-L-isoaspartate(D-aspartate) O-methyltransferase